MSTERDQHVPGDKWEFDASVASCFDDMLERSIPQYAAMRQLCLDVGSRFVKPRTDVVDLGCSRGGAIADFVRRFGVTVRFVGCEVSAPMLQECRMRFAGYIDAGTVDIRDVDLRREFPVCDASLILSVLTLQFTPIEHRLRIVDDVLSHLRPGGAFVLVEKILGCDRFADEMLVDLYYGMKRAHGYTEQDIERKRLSLEGVLVPKTAHENEGMLRDAGFKHVECFWRTLNFAAWVAVKP